jgi:hypothetical protein
VQGATFYLDNGVIVGVLLCNIEDKDEIERARQVIRDRVDYSDLKRIEMEAELRELLGFEIQHPMTRSTMSKTAGHKKACDDGLPVWCSGFSVCRCA